jgi:hypothetical protein
MFNFLFIVPLLETVNQMISHKGTTNKYMHLDGKKTPKSDYTVQQDAEI